MVANQDEMKDSTPESWRRQLIEVADDQSSEWPGFCCC